MTKRMTAAIAWTIGLLLCVGKAHAQHYRMGIEVADQVIRGVNGVVVEKVPSDSLAREFLVRSGDETLDPGLKPGDVIRYFEKQFVRSSDELRKMVNEFGLRNGDKEAFSMQIERGSLTDIQVYGTLYRDDDTSGLGAVKDTLSLPPGRTTRDFILSPKHAK